MAVDDVHVARDLLRDAFLAISGFHLHWYVPSAESQNFGFCGTHVRNLFCFARVVNFRWKLGSIENFAKIRHKGEQILQSTIFKG